MASTKYTLRDLPYSYDALEPYISEQIMTLHHSKHHQTYINNLNAALASQAAASTTDDLVTQLHLQAAINFNAGGHINHSLFWANLCPPSTSNKASATLTKALEARWGSVQSFQNSFAAVLLGIKGSGWGWLVQDLPTGNLELLTSKDQDVVPAGKKPLLGIDMWEHAYYLQYLNDKAGYVKGIWTIVNWGVVESRLAGGKDEVWGELGPLKSAM